MKYLELWVKFFILICNYNLETHYFNFIQTNFTCFIKKNIFIQFKKIVNKKFQFHSNSERTSHGVCFVSSNYQQQVNC